MGDLPADATWPKARKPIDPAAKKVCVCLANGSLWFPIQCLDRKCIQVDKGCFCTGSHHEL